MCCSLNLKTWFARVLIIFMHLFVVIFFRWTFLCLIFAFLLFTVLFSVFLEVIPLSWLFVLLRNPKFCSHKDMRYGMSFYRKSSSWLLVCEQKIESKKSIFYFGISCSSDIRCMNQKYVHYYKNILFFTYLSINIREHHLEIIVSYISKREKRIQ